jgi:predicted extracellular nuclease
MCGLEHAATNEPSSAMSTPTDLFISEYVEGSSNNKYIEIFNGTGEAIDLSDYQLRLYSNGASSPSTTSTLSGVLADGQVIVYENSAAAAYMGPATSLSAVSFNGDDAIELFKISTTSSVDIFGVIGDDPGSAWTGAGGYSTQNKTLQRKSSVMGGITTNPGGTGSSAFTTLVPEWNLFSQDDVSNLGSHTIDGPGGGLSAVCANPTLYLDADGDITVTVNDIDGGSTADSLIITDSIFSCADLGPQNIMLIAYDSVGNADTCIAFINIVDSIAPITVCSDITVYLDSIGSVALDSNALEAGSTDNCGIESVEPGTAILTTQHLTIPGFEDLFFSEYIEGSSNNKYLEIFNGTGSAVDLSNYRLTLISNSGSMTSEQLSGTLTDGAVIVYANGGASIYQGATTASNTINFNGDDAIMLYNISKGRVADIFGVVGNDPGASWTGPGGYSTQNQTLVRRSFVGHGVLQNPTGSGPEAFTTLTTQWDVFDINDTTHLGFHTQDVVIPNYTIVNHLATDSSSNTGVCAAQVTVVDTFNPALAMCRDTNLYLDQNGRATLDASLVSDSSTGIAFEVDPAIFSCGNLGINSVTLSAWSGDGSTSTCSASLTISDTTSPVAICRDTLIYLDMTGNAVLDAEALDNGSTDNCAVDSFHASQTVYTTSDVGPNLIILTAFDASGNADTCISTVTVADTNGVPFILCQDITVFLDNMGMVSITPEDVDNGSSGSLSIDSMDFDCSEIGPNSVILTATNSNGSDSCLAVVTVLDTLAPTTICSDITIYLTEMGTVTIDSNALDQGSTDNCAVSSVTLSQTTFTAADAAAGGITELFISEYVEGSSNNKYIEIYNGTGSIVDLSGYQLRLYSGGSASPGSTTNLSGMLDHDSVKVYSNSSANIYTGPTTNAGAIGFNGDDAIELYNTTTGMPADIFGHIGEDPGTQWTAPGGFSTLDQTLIRKASVKSGVTINPSAAGFPTLGTEWISLAQDDVSNLGMHFADTTAGITVIQTAMDASGNSTNCEARVLVIDTFMATATALCQDITVYLDDAGEATILVSDADAGSAGDSIYITDDFFDCGDLGMQTIFLIAQDTAGFMDSCLVTVTVEDTLAPIVSCQDITVFLQDGVAMIDSNALDNGSIDNCGIMSFALSQSDFTVADTGVGPSRVPTDLFISEYVEGSSNNKYLEIFNGTGNPIDLSNYELRIYFNGATNFSSQALVGSLASGSAKVYANSSATSYMGPSTSATTVCDFTGDDAVVLYNVTTNSFVDIFGNIGDDPGSSWFAPGGLTTANKTSRRKATSVYGVTMDPTGSGGASFDTYESNWEAFDFDTISGLGSHNLDTSGLPGVLVTMTVTDQSGNVDSCSAQVVVVDLSATALCADATVYLDASGNHTLTVAEVDGGSTGDTLYLLDDMLDCGDLGATLVSLVAMDDDGAADTCMANVMVLDTIAPVANCQNITVYFDEMGMVTLDSAALNNGSTDNCGIASYSLSQTSFGCGSNATPMSNDLIISEYVEGSLANRYVEIYNGTGAAVDLSNYELRRYNAGSTTPASAALSGMLANGDVIVLANPSATAYTGTVTTVSNLSNNGDDALELYKVSTASSVDIFGVIGDDPGIAWIGAGGYTTANATLRRKSTIFDGVTVNPSGTGDMAFITLTTEWDLFGTDDVSGLGSHTVTAPTVTNVNVTQTVGDASGNMGQCTAVVTLSDTSAPMVMTQDITVSLDGTGSAMIVADTIDNGSTDNCTVDSIYLDKTNFSCRDVGDNLVTLTVLDASGNMASGTANVHVIAADIHIAYVDSTATGTGSGSSWVDAFSSLREALASPCYTNVDTIFMAAGSYYPSVTARDSSFVFPNNVVVIGGHPAGGGIRNVAANRTILSGDVGVLGSSTDNVYHVVRIAPGNVGILLDGLTISGGYANGGGLNNEGGGILCEGKATFKQLTVSSNFSTGHGSAISILGANADALLQNSVLTSSNSSTSNIRLSVDGMGVILVVDSTVE